MSNETKRLVLDRKSKAAVLQWVILSFDTMVKDGLSRDAIFERCRSDTGVKMNKDHFWRFVADCDKEYPKRQHVSVLNKNASLRRTRTICRWVRRNYLRTVTIQEVLQDLCKNLGMEEHREKLGKLPEIDLNMIEDFLQGRPVETPV